MAIKEARSIAEYAIRRWLVEQGFFMESFGLIMDGKEGKLTDRQGDSLVLVYDCNTKSVYIKED
ncbi:MAG: hypothetical protein K2P87_00590 [Lachnospiraceae bacterium]|nr:hypothetical protein [Lachnospiraceae bacterium]